MVLLISVCISVLSLSLLAVYDPKRLRWRHKLAGQRNAARPSLQPLNRGNRRLLAAVALAPGAVLAGAGMWAAFMLWLGLGLSYAWLASEVLAARSW